MEFHLLVIRLLAIVVCSLLLREFGKELGRFLYLTSKIPGPTLWQMVTVHAKHLLSDNMVSHSYKLCDVYNYKPWGTWLMDLNYVIFVSDRESVSAAFKLQDKPDIFYKQISQVLGRNLLTMNGPEYPQYRKMFGNALRKSLLDHSIRRMAEPMSELVEELREKAASGKDVDLQSLIMRHTIKLSTATFASNLLPNANNVIDMIAKVMEPTMELVQMETINPIYYWLYVRFKSSTRRTKALLHLGLAAFDDIMIHEKSRFLSTEDKGDFRDTLQTFISSYLKTVYREDNDQQLCKETRLLFSASFDTTGFVVNCLLLVLALYHDVQQRVCDEIDSVLGEKEMPISAEDLQRMEYMEMVIKETLRLFPAGAVIARSVRQETNINGILAPEGSVVMINIMALHRNPEYFPDPLWFDPNRFSPEASRNLRPYCYLPFSAGFRQCPGQQYAFAMMKIMLCHVLRNFRILPGSKLKSLDNIKVKMCFTMHLRESSLRLVNRSLERKKV